MRLNQHIKTTGTLRGWEGAVPTAGLRANDARRAACPTCGAKPPAACRGLRRQFLKAPHPERRAAMRAQRQGEARERSH